MALIMSPFLKEHLRLSLSQGNFLWIKCLLLGLLTQCILGLLTQCILSNVNMMSFLQLEIFEIPGQPAVLRSLLCICLQRSVFPNEMKGQW